MKTTDKISAACERVKLDVSLIHSGSSSSEYLVIEDDADKRVKIRVSNHKLPPSYERIVDTADYDVSVAGVYEGCCSLHWWDAVAYVSGIFGRPMDWRAARSMRIHYEAKGRNALASQLRLEESQRRLEHNTRALNDWLRDNSSHELAQAVITGRIRRDATPRGRERRKIVKKINKTLARIRQRIAADGSATEVVPSV